MWPRDWSRSKCHLTNSTLRIIGDLANQHSFSGLLRRCLQDSRLGASQWPASGESDRVEELKEEAESGQEHFEQEATTAKVTLAKFGSEANKIDAIALGYGEPSLITACRAKGSDRLRGCWRSPPIESRRGVARCKHFQLFVPSCKGGGIWQVDKTARHEVLPDMVGSFWSLDPSKWTAHESQQDHCYPGRIPCCPPSWWESWAREEGRKFIKMLSLVNARAKDQKNRAGRILEKRCLVAGLLWHKQRFWEGCEGSSPAPAGELHGAEKKNREAELQYESIRWLEEVAYSFNKLAISQTSKEKVKKNAGDFDILIPQIPQHRGR